MNINVRSEIGNLACQYTTKTDDQRKTRLPARVAGGGGLLTGENRQTVKELPQPHDPVALGLLKVKPDPMTELT